MKINFFIYENPYFTNENQFLTYENQFFTYLNKFCTNGNILILQKISQSALIYIK